MLKEESSAGSIGITHMSSCGGRRGERGVVKFKVEGQLQSIYFGDRFGGV